MTTSEPLSTGGGALFDLPLTSSPAGSRASRSRPPAAAVALPTPGGDGPGCATSSPLFDLDTSSLRTWRTSFVTLRQFQSSSATLPRSGSMSNGMLYRRAPWVPHTHVPGCSSWPTPRTVMASIKVHFTAVRPGYGLNLEEVVAIREGRPVDGYLNPRWIEWLMGFPAGWCETASTP